MKQRQINVALDVEDTGEARLLAQVLEGLPEVRLIGSLNGKRPLTPLHVIVTGGEGGAPAHARLESIRKRVPDAQIFYVSRDQRPEHVVEVMRAGAAEFLPAPVSAARLAEAVERVRARLSSEVSEALGKIVSFVSSKGGLGATVLAVNSAVAMARTSGKRVALVDLSLRAGDSAVLLDLAPKTTVADVCRNLHRLDHSLLGEAYIQHESGLHYLPAPREPEEAEAVTEEATARVLRMSQEIFDFVFVDCSSMGTDSCTRAAFLGSRHIFVLSDLSLPAVRNTARLTRVLHNLGVDGERVEVVVNRYLKGGFPSVGEIERTLGRKIYWLFPNEFGGVVASINRGKPLVAGEPSAPFSKSVREFVEKLVDPLAQGAYRGVKGFLGKTV
jgi:pilus assembly protein CpaE